MVWASGVSAEGYNWIEGYIVGTKFYAKLADSPGYFKFGYWSTGKGRKCFLYNILDREEDFFVYTLAFCGLGNFVRSFDFAFGLNVTGDVYEFNFLTGQTTKFLIFFELRKCEVVLIDADGCDGMFFEKFLPVEFYLFGIFPKFGDVYEFDVFIDAVFGALDVTEVGEEVGFGFCLQKETGGAGEVG